MAELITGGLVGALIAEITLFVKDTITTIKRFRSRLKSIVDRLESLKPQFDKMKGFNDLMDRPNEELRPIYELLKKCQDLVKKCTTIRKWQLYDKHQCSKELQDLDNQIVGFCGINLVTIIASDVKEANAAISEMKDEIRDGMNRMSLLVQTASMGEKGIGGSKFKSCNVPQAPDFVVGLDIPFKNIKDKLLHGSEAVVIISAAGGYGKSTLVSKLCHDGQVKGKYKDIIFAVVSESPNLMTIVQQIMNHLGATVPDPETHNEADAVRELQQVIAERANKSPILLVLDDIWSGSESILEKFVNKEVPNYKVLVTSRFEFPAFGCSEKLEGLQKEDAVKLLRHSATPLTGAYSLPNDEIVCEVVKHCKGSPLALTVVGRSLCGKTKASWQVKLKEWSSGTSLIGTSEIMKCLMYSLQDLDGGLDELAQVKSCFLDLGSFPEDHEISVAALVDMWSELYDVDGNGVDAVANIEELSARNLADLIIKKEDISEGDGYYNDMYVKQHDLLRDLAIYQNSQGPVEKRERLNLNIRKNNVPTFLKDQKQPFDARLISICTDEEFSSSSWPDLELPKAEVLVLNFMATKNNYALPGFIKKMANLKTLIITNNGPGLAELANFHLISSLTSLKKIRLEHIKIPSFTTENYGLCLSNLEKISVFHCDISEEIQTTDLPIHEMFPKLKEIDISYCSSLNSLPDAICKAKTLKKISISNCHKLSELPEEIGNLSGLQVLRLNTCTDLESLPSSIGDLKNLSFLDISNCVSIIKLPDEIEELHQLKEFHISWCSNLSIKPASARQLKQLELLIVDKKQVNFKRFFRNSPNLKLKVAVEDRSLNFLGGISR